MQSNTGDSSKEERSEKQALSETRSKNKVGPSAGASSQLSEPGDSHDKGKGVLG